MHVDINRCLVFVWIAQFDMHASAQLVLSLLDQLPNDATLRIPPSRHNPIISTLSFMKTLSLFHQISPS